jgi:poly(A) polymerase
VAIERELGRAPDPLLRLAALADGTDAAAMQARVRLSAAETQRLAHATVQDCAFDPHNGEDEARASLYRIGPQAFADGALLDWARSGEAPTSSPRALRVRLPERWQAPELPVRGADVLALGVKPGPDVGRVIAAFEAWWIAAGFPADHALIAAKLKELARASLA